jgi:predicted dehydrogenase
LATNAEQLAHVLQTYAGAAEGGLASQTDWGPEMPMLMVGFNRRFSPTAQWLKQRFSTVYDPLAVHCTVNAGFTPADSWVHDAEQGGGRIIGEVCHFIDLVQYFTDALAVRVHAETIKAAGYLPSDNVAVTLQMSDGSIGSIVYVSGGDQSYARERVEIFGGVAVGIINNFKAAVFTHGGRKERMRQWLSIDRGHRAEVHELVTAIQEGGPPPVSMTEYVNTTLATLGIEDALRSGQATVLEARWASGAT